VWHFSAGLFAFLVPEIAMNTSKEPEGRRLVSAVELAQEINVSRFTILKWFREKRIPGHALTRRCVRFDHDQVKAALGL
jgi:excisionase family DNA binding protein